MGLTPKLIKQVALVIYEQIRIPENGELEQL